jgi:ketosteroid isomerase-like protein
MLRPVDTVALAVRGANEAFYEALEQLDMHAMTRIWTRGALDICIHPGWPPLSGWTDVQESWRAIFTNTTFMKFSISETSVQVFGDVARVTCLENIFSLSGGTRMHSQVAATNLFVLGPQGWRITLHHGSPVASRVARLPPDEADA